MKTILTFFPICFCTAIYAQEENTTSAEKEETPPYTPFAWYLEQEEQKEAFLQEKLDSLSLFSLKNRTKTKSVKKVPIILNMPVYTGPKGLSLMPVIPVDTTNTTYYYLKVYPAKE